MKLVIKNSILLLLTQILLFIIPGLYLCKEVSYIGFILNIIVTWIIIKNVEKKYYKNYYKSWSLLYMICPVIGVLLLSYIIYLTTKETFLINYYIALIIGVYILNIIYIIYRKIKG